MKMWLFLVVVVTLAGVLFWWQTTPEPSWTDEYIETLDKKPHTHGDFLVYIGSEKIDFSQDKYQSTAESIKSERVHLHDNKGDVIHFHAEGVDLQTFFSSLGFSLSEECLETDTGGKYCVDENNVLELYVNGQLVQNAPEYVANDEDRILLYYGPPNQPVLEQYLEEVSDLACMYSGDCPERGTPPPEECGLTCEL